MTTQLWIYLKIELHVLHTPAEMSLLVNVFDLKTYFDQYFVACSELTVMQTNLRANGSGRPFPICMLLTQGQPVQF